MCYQFDNSYVFLCCSITLEGPALTFKGLPRVYILTADDVCYPLPLAEDGGPKSPRLSGSGKNIRFVHGQGEYATRDIVKKRNDLPVVTAIVGS